MERALHTKESVYSLRHVPSWLLLAGAAGTVNGFAFLKCREYVTHVTGIVTRVGLEWQTLGVIFGYLLVIVCFMLGAAASVVAIQGRIHRGKPPQWFRPLLTVALILAAVAVSGQAGGFGTGKLVVAAQSPAIVLLSILAFAMGLQNAAVATSTGLAVRTTHLTGSATHFGIHLGVVCLAGGEARRFAARAACLRGGKMISFAVGAGLAVPLIAAVDYLTLLLPAALVLTAALLSFRPETVRSQPSG
jgi:uncharacterized membrane protein YoaK (UPF0700 family)